MKHTYFLTFLFKVLRNLSTSLGNTKNYENKLLNLNEEISETKKEKNVNRNENIFDDDKADNINIDNDNNNNNNNLISKIDRVAIDKLLSEHRSDIIKLSFLRKSSQTNSRSTTPLLLPSSTYFPLKTYENEEILDDDHNNDKSKNINFHSKKTFIDNEKEISGETVLEISVLLETRISEIEESKINQNLKSQNNENAVDTDSVVNLRNPKRFIMEENKTKKSQMNEISNKNTDIQHNSKSPFWSDNGEIDDSSDYLRFPPIIHTKTESERNQNTDFVFLPPPKSKRTYYENMQNCINNDGEVEIGLKREGEVDVEVGREKDAVIRMKREMNMKIGRGENEGKEVEEEKRRREVRGRKQQIDCNDDENDIDHERANDNDDIEIDNNDDNDNDAKHENENYVRNDDDCDDDDDDDDRDSDNSDSNIDCAEDDGNLGK